MKTIELSKGKVAIVDDVDYAFLNQFSWSVTGVRRVYAKRRVHKNKMMLMHRQIMNVLDRRIQVDHINGDSLDNRRCNLRLCLNAENLLNRGAQKNNTSGFKGVSWSKAAKKWTARIKAENTYMHLGLFITKEEAAQAYNEAALKYHGEFAKLNEVLYVR